jgi:hypothetical protein
LGQAGVRTVRFTDGLLPAATLPLNDPVPATFNDDTPSFSVPERPHVPAVVPPDWDIVRLNVEFSATP